MNFRRLEHRHFSLATLNLPHELQHIVHFLALAQNLRKKMPELSGSKRLGEEIRCKVLRIDVHHLDKPALNPLHDKIDLDQHMPQTLREPTVLGAHLLC